MRNPGGYGQAFGPLGNVEHDTFTCKHCQRVMIVLPKAKPEDVGGFCKLCAALICPTCVGLGCKPYEEEMRELEKGILTNEAKERNVEIIRRYAKVGPQFTQPFG